MNVAAAEHVMSEMENPSPAEKPIITETGGGCPFAATDEEVRSAVEKVGAERENEEEDREKAVLYSNLDILSGFLTPSSASGSKESPKDSDDLETLLGAFDAVIGALNGTETEETTPTLPTTTPAPTAATAATAAPPIVTLVDPASEAMSRIRRLPLETRRLLLSQLVAAVPIAAASMSSAGVPPRLIAPLSEAVPGFLRGAFAEGEYDYDYSNNSRRRQFA